MNEAGFRLNGEISIISSTSHGKGDSLDSPASGEIPRSGWSYILKPARTKILPRYEVHFHFLQQGKEVLCWKGMKSALHIVLQIMKQQFLFLNYKLNSTLRNHYQARVRTSASFLVLTYFGHHGSSTVYRVLYFCFFQNRNRREFTIDGEEEINSKKGNKSSGSRQSS